MCVVSAVHDSVSQQFPLYPVYPQGISSNPQWTWDLYYKFQEMIKKVEEFDALINAKECLDPAKAEFLKEIYDYLKDKDKLK